MSSFPEYELDVVGYAQVKAAATCLAGADIGLPPPDRYTSHVQVNLALFGPTTEAYARTYGFGPGSARDWQAPQLLGSTGAFGAKLIRCEERAWRALGPHARAVYLDYVALSGVVSSEYGMLMTQTIQAENLNANLLDCLIGEGYAVLDRAGFLANPFPGHFGIKTGSLQVSYVPTSDEAEFAVAFARCNRTTGRLDRLLARSRQAQDMVMRDHEAEMAVLDAELAPLARRAAALTGLS